MPHICKTDLLKSITYLQDAQKLYEALSSLQIQKCKCRAHMIAQHINKLKTLNK